jgi:Zn-dependent protease with chaperone function
MNPSRRRLALGALATTALTALASTLPTGASAQGGGFSVSGKRGPFLRQVATRRFDNTGGGSGAMGLANDAVNLGRYQAARIRMPQTEAKVGQLLAGLDGQWPYAKGGPLQVHILGVDYYNAYSLPDGSIVVAFGLLDSAQSDDEVAFVLAHELGHVRLGHFAHQPNTQQQRAHLASSLGQFFTVASALPIGGAPGAALSAANQAGATNDLIHFMANVMVEPAHTRDQEDEADCIGYDLSQRASYAPDAATARVFDTIQADQQQHDQTVNSLDSQLKTQLSQAITPSSAQSFLSGNTGDMRTGLLEGAGRLALGMAANSSGHEQPQHRPPEERKRGIAQYSSEAYPEGAPLRDEQRSWLASVRGTGEFAQGKIAVAAVTEAKRARADGRYGVAAAALRRAQHSAFSAAPLVLNEAARLADDQGDQRAADRLFAQANASPDQTVDGYVDYVRMLYRAQQNDRAMQVIQEGVSRFGDDQKPFIALMIAVARQQGREDQVQGYLRTCQGYNNDNLSRDCRLAAGESAEAPAPSTPHMPSLPFSLPHF